MKKFFLFLLVALPSAFAADPIPNRLIDYPGFQKIVEASGPEREAHRLTEGQFIEAMSDPSVVVLDARSPAMYARRHIRGAINLPLPILRRPHWLERSRSGRLGC